MKRRSYRQYCSLAKALDVVGERWTLLMIRELMIGPRRYRDLLKNLPGMGTNLLATRLKELESNGVIEHVSTGDSERASVYRLTDRGIALEPVIRGLVQWGVELLGAPQEDELSRSEWDLVAIRMLFRPEQAVDCDGYYVLQATDLQLFFCVEGGRVSLLDVLPEGEKACVIVGSYALLRALILGETKAADALASQDLRVKGSIRRAKRFFDCFATLERPLRSQGDHHVPISQSDAADTGSDVPPADAEEAT